MRPWNGKTVSYILCMDLCHYFCCRNS